MNLAILTVNSPGEKIAKKLEVGLSKSSFKITRIKINKTVSSKNYLAGIFKNCNGLIFISALGIAVRFTSPFIKNKFIDPAVVCVDTEGRFAISVLSGHEGGANKLAYKVSEILDAIPVITTGKEVRKIYIIGIGTRRGIIKEKVKSGVIEVLKKAEITPESVRLAATIDLKKDETGLKDAFSELGIPLVFMSKESIGNFKGNLASSEIVKRNIGLDGVCEPCALLAGRRTKLILKKLALDGMAIAIAKET